VDDASGSGMLVQPQRLRVPVEGQEPLRIDPHPPQLRDNGDVEFGRP